MSEGQGWEESELNVALHRVGKPGLWRRRLIDATPWTARGAWPL